MDGRSREVRAAPERRSVLIAWLVASGRRVGMAIGEDDVEGG